MKPELRRIVKEDFSQDDWEIVEKLGNILNPFMEQVVSNLSKNIGDDNLQQEKVTLSFLTNSVGQPISKLSFKLNTLRSVSGLQVISLKLPNQPQGVITTAPFVSFSQAERVVYISYIAGLEKETKYQITLLLN